LRAARANRVFRTDEKRIRTENTVMNKPGFGVVVTQYPSHNAEGPGGKVDLHGLSAYQNIQGARRPDFVDTRASLG